MYIMPSFCFFKLFILYFCIFSSYVALWLILIFHCNLSPTICCSVTKLYLTLCDPMTTSWSLLKIISIELMMSSNHLFLCHPLLLLHQWSYIFCSIKVISNQLALHIRWSKCWSFCFSISPSNEYSGVISFWIDWLDLCSPRDSQESSPAPQFKNISSLAVSLLYDSTLTSIHDYWKNHSFDYMNLCWQSDVSVFNMLSSLSSTTNSLYNSNM